MRRRMRIGARQAEVDDARGAVAREHHVLGLDVAMDDAHRVRGRQAVGDLHREIEQALQRQRPARQLVAQRLAFEPLRDEVVATSPSTSAS